MSVDTIGFYYWTQLGGLRPGLSDGGKKQFRSDDQASRLRPPRDSANNEPPGEFVS